MGKKLLSKPFPCFLPQYRDCFLAFFQRKPWYLYLTQVQIEIAALSNGERGSYGLRHVVKLDFHFFWREETIFHRGGNSIHRRPLPDGL